MMQVSADQIATMRAYLEGDFERYRRLHDQRDRNANLAFSALLTAAFLEAVRRRFPEGTKGSDLIDFIGDVRTRYEGLTEKIDPYVAERLLRTTLTGEDDDDLDTGQKIHTRFLLLYVLIADEQHGEAGLDAILTEARTLADKWIVDD